MALRAEGLKYREIAAELGVPLQTVYAWVTDPDGAKLRARKASYAGRCADCGGPTTGNDGRNAAPERCFSCERERVQSMDPVERARQGRRRLAARLRYSRQDCIAAVRKVAHGRSRLFESEYAASSKALGLPSLPTVIKRFDGSWAAACEAAGLEAVTNPARGWRKRSDREMLDGLVAYHAEHGRLPSARAYDRFTAEHPRKYAALHTLRLRFGGWPFVLERAAALVNSASEAAA